MSTNLCPICAGGFKLTASGRLPRHGFKAENVRHGETGGFHIGGHGGDLPIGTVSGNNLALRTACQHEATADLLSSQPSHTILQAEEQALTDIWQNRVRGWKLHRSWGASSTEAPKRPTAEAVRTDVAFLSVRGWLSRKALIHRAGHMDRARAATIEAHRQHTATLRQLVSENQA